MNYFSSRRVAVKDGSSPAATWAPDLPSGGGCSGRCSSTGSASRPGLWRRPAPPPASGRSGPGRSGPGGGRPFVSRLTGSGQAPSAWPTSRCWSARSEQRATRGAGVCWRTRCRALLVGVRLIREGHVVCELHQLDESSPEALAGAAAYLACADQTALLSSPELAVRWTARVLAGADSLAWVAVWENVLLRPDNLVWSWGVRACGPRSDSGAALACAEAVDCLLEPGVVENRSLLSQAPVLSPRWKGWSARCRPLQYGRAARENPLAGIQRRPRQQPRRRSRKQGRGEMG
jgi:hypothetical protein